MSNLSSVQQLSLLSVSLMIGFLVFSWFEYTLAQEKKIKTFFFIKTLMAIALVLSLVPHLSKPENFKLSAKESPLAKKEASVVKTKDTKTPSTLSLIMDEGKMSIEKDYAKCQSFPSKQTIAWEFMSFQRKYDSRLNADDRSKMLSHPSRRLLPCNTARDKSLNELANLKDYLKKY